MARKKKTMDGNNAAAYVSYAFTEVAGILGIHRIRKSSMNVLLFSCFIVDDYKSFSMKS